MEKPILNGLTITYDISEEEKINEMFENTSKGFLYKETIYRVKKND